MSPLPAEDQADLHFIPFPPIERLAVIGDRRSAAMIAADGTVCWMCNPRFDGLPIFGALLDLKKGGFWRLGPEDREFGEQSYTPGTAVLVTRWEAPDSVIELTECMLWPGDDRPEDTDGRRVLVRRLRCLSGQRRVSHNISPCEDFRSTANVSGVGHDLRLQMRTFDLGLWCSMPLEISDDGTMARHVGELRADEEIWAVLDGSHELDTWTVEKAARALEETTDYWRDWSSQLKCAGVHADQIKVAAMVVHLLTYAPTGAIIAAPTTSLPERVPGDYNYDYRYCWLRDGSIAAGLLSQLGVPAPTGKFLSWVAEQLAAETDDQSTMPLQVLYRIDGGSDVIADERSDISGYRGCQPVRFGNPVYQMRELDGFGFLNDCALLFVQNGGELTDQHWELVRRGADFIAHNWRNKDAGTWELIPYQNFVATKVMDWVTLDRAIAIARLTGRKPSSRWKIERPKIHADVLANGWSEKMGSFRQRYEDDALDGALLLIPLMGFLPPQDPRVKSTVERIDKVLKLNGLVHRFVPLATPGRPDQPMGDREGAFLMCTFWLAQAWQMLGEPSKARGALARAEKCRGGTGLFSEAADARHNPGLLGNMPLLFSQVEYARAVKAMS